MNKRRFSHVLKLQLLAALSVGVLLPAQLESQGSLDSVRQAAKGSGRFDTQQQVEQRQKRLEEFLKEHTDPTGQARQDLWLKGIYDRMTTLETATTALL